MDVRIAGTDITARDFTNEQLGRLSVELAAFDGEIGSGFFAMPDPSGNDDFKGGRELRIRDAGCTIVDGFIGSQVRTRNIFPNWSQREHLYNTVDANALLYGFRVHELRPAETDYARVLYFFQTYRPQWDTTWILNTNTVSMASKYYDSADGFQDLITDVRDIAGKTVFVHDKRGGQGRCAHFHRLTEGHPCGISISDVVSAVNGVTVFAPKKYPSRTFAPNDLKNTIYGRDQAGRTAFDSSATSIADHNADGMQFDAIVDFEAASQAELQTKVVQYLTEHQYEVQTYEIDIGPLDFASMMLWNVGDLIPVTSNVLGLPNSGSPHRISHATITVSKDTSGKPLPGLWDVHLELGRPVRAYRHTPAALPLSPYIPSDPSCWECTLESVPGPCTDESPNLIVDVPAGHNATIVYTFAVSGATQTTGWTNGDILVKVDGGSTQELDILSRFKAGGATEDNLAWGDGTFASLTYESSAAMVLAGQTQPTATVSAPIGGLPWELTIVGLQQIIVGLGWSALSTLTLCVTQVIDATTDVVLWEGEVVPPRYSQKTCEQLEGDGTVGPYTLNFPYIQNSLSVTVDGVSVVPDETDPTTGEFELAAITSGVIVACYQATGSPTTGATNPQPTPASPSGGGVTAHSALTGLPAPADDHTQYTRTIEGGGDKVFAHGSMGSTETFDPTDGNVHTGTLDANLTITLGAPPATRAGATAVCTLELYITASGTRTWTWPGSVVWPDGVTPDPPASGLLSRIILETLDGGTTWYGNAVGGSSSLTVEDEGTPLATAATTLDFVGAGVAATGTGAEKTITIAGVTEAAVRDIGHWEVIVSGTAPPVAVSNPADDDWLYGWVPG